MIKVRNIIIRELHNYLQLPVAPNNSVQDRPGYPYVSYAITAVIADSGEGNLEWVGEDDLTVVRLQNKLSLSFTGYSRNDNEAYETVKKVYDWFKHKGVNILKDNSIATVEVMSIENRTLLEVDKYESRYGCDVILRYEDTIDRKDVEIKEHPVTGSSEKYVPPYA